MLAKSPRFHLTHENVTAFGASVPSTQLPGCSSHHFLQKAFLDPSRLAGWLGGLSCVFSQVPFFGASLLPIYNLLFIYYYSYICLPTKLCTV